MKKIFLILALAVIGCNTPDAVYYECHDSKVVILKKEISHGTRGGAFYYLYVFDGETAQTYHTNKETYNSHQEGDTINTLILNKSEIYTKK